MYVYGYVCMNVSMYKSEMAKFNRYSDLPGKQAQFIESSTLVRSGLRPSHHALRVGRANC